MTQFETPIAFLVFNRPDTTARVFEAIRRARPSKLLVVADGPRETCPDEYEKCSAVRAIIDQVDWPCTVLKNYSETNLGCKTRVSTGLDWVFEEVEEAIILEDDCLPHSSFFGFCAMMLEKYRNDLRISSINGNHSVGTIQGYSHSYYYTIFPNIWGWATWRRSWQRYDVTMSSWPQSKKNKLLDNIFCKYPPLASEWSVLFDKTYRGITNTWDYQFVLSSFESNSLSIQPYVNLIKNIGFGENATITKNPNSPRSNQVIDSMPATLTFPGIVERCYLQEVIATQNMSMWYKLKNKLISTMMPIYCHLLDKRQNYHI